MFTLYILQSITTNKFYIGHTEDIQRRLLEHNAGKSSSTKSGVPWKIVYTEQYGNRSDAMQRERKLKSLKSRESIIRLIQKEK